MKLPYNYIFGGVEGETGCGGTLTAVRFLSALAAGYHTFWNEDTDERIYLTDDERAQVDAVRQWLTCLYSGDCINMLDYAVYSIGTYRTILDTIVDIPLEQVDGSADWYLPGTFRMNLPAGFYNLVLEATTAYESASVMVEWLIRGEQTNNSLARMRSSKDSGVSQIHNYSVCFGVDGSEWTRLDARLLQSGVSQLDFATYAYNRVTVIRLA